MNYIATYTPDQNDIGMQTLTLNAQSDAAAVAELREAVEQGFRNKAFGSVVLADGRTYSAHNQQGNAVGHYV